MALTSSGVLTEWSSEPEMPEIDQRVQRPPAAWVSRLALGVLLVAGTAAFVPLLIPGSDTNEEGSGSTSAQLVFIACYAVLLFVGWSRPTARPKGLSPDPLMYLLLALAGASTLWSLSPDTSARRTVGLALTIAVASLLPRMMSLRELLSTLRTTCWFVSLSSLMYAAVANAAARDVASPSALRGVFTTKNELGRFSAFAFVVFLVSALILDGRTRRRSVLGLVCAALLLYLARSATSVTVTALVAAVTLVFWDLQRRGIAALRWVVPAAIAAIAGLVATWFLLEVSGVTRLLGRDATFTGRIELWRLVWEAIARHTWLGYGYQAFWVTPDGPAGDIRARIPFPVPHSHDGFLDLWLELGIVGVALFSLVLLRALAHACRATVSGSEAGLAAVVVLVFMVASNVTESNLLRANSCYLLVLLALCAYVGSSRAHGEPSMANRHADD